MVTFPPTFYKLACLWDSFDIFKITWYFFTPVSQNFGNANDSNDLQRTLIYLHFLFYNISKLELLVQILSQIFQFRRLLVFYPSLSLLFQYLIHNCITVCKSTLGAKEGNFTAERAFQLFFSDSQKLSLSLSWTLKFDGIRCILSTISNISDIGFHVCPNNNVKKWPLRI